METSKQGMLRVCEIFRSIQGESSYAGRICSFVRLSGCNLRCSYCDTGYAVEQGSDMSLEETIERVTAYRTDLVEITGGEPLLQKETPALCGTLLERGHTVLVETNGSIDISVVPPGCIRVVDVKCPGSGMGDSFLDSNYGLLTSKDECKMVISSRHDFDWALGLVRSMELYRRCGNVIFSPNWEALEPSQLASWILESDAPVRLGLQVHKLLWGDKRGV